MPNAYHDILFTDAVKAEQDALGSRSIYAKYEASPKMMKTALTEPEMHYITTRDSLYVASVGETGWPYMQHRGGPAGFVKVLDETTIGWAEYAGNRQYITTGNLKGNDRVSLFLIDYASKTRLKLLGHAQTIGADDARMKQLVDEGNPAVVERGMIIKIASYEWNCPKYITERYTRDEVQAALAQMGAGIAELEAELAASK